MRFHLGAIPKSLDFIPDASWRSLREPSPWLMQLMALPVGLIGLAVVGGLWFLLTPLGNQSFPPGLIFGVVVLLIPIHELVHAVVHPRYGISNQSILGFWPAKGLFYAHYAGEMSRARLIAILLAPLVLISFAPLIVCAVARVSSSYLAVCSAMNALFACVDITAAGLLLFQVPADAKVRNQGYNTYWKENKTAVG